MIPDEAIESAAWGVYKAMHPDAAATSLGQIGALMRAESESIARAALESVAPHLMAAAWDEGEAAGFQNAGAEQWGYDQKFNPYRPTNV